MVGRLIVLGTALAALAAAAPARAAAVSCPGGAPAKTITVVNQAKVRSHVLARVERAVSAQSLQVRGAWGTPCAQFSAGGWKLYLKVGGAEPHGEHDFYGQPYALVWTSGATMQGWSRDFSHEVIEMLEDPTLDVRYMHDGSTWQLEIADPVEGLGYRLDGVYVSDFVTPLWYAGASTGADVLCQGVSCADDSPLIAPADNAGPWDQMRALTSPWSEFGPRILQRTSSGPA
jgi:hypothetical protein